MSLNEKNKPTYGTVPAVDSGATKGSRRNLVVGLAAAVCFALGVAAANVVPTQGLRGAALYRKDTSTVWNNEDGVDNISGGDVKAGGCVGGPCGDSGFTKPAPPVAGVAGVPGLGNNVSPPAPPATPATHATPAADNCCQASGSCPAGYPTNSGNWGANQICCKSLSERISISSDMPTCPATAGDPIGPITTPTIGPIKTPHTETPAMPSMPAMPKMPAMPTMPTMPQIGPIKTPHTETIGPVVQTGDKPITIGGPTQTDNCCQVFGSCPEGYKSSGTVVPNTACCKDPSKGLSMSSDMPMCPDGGSVFGPSKSPFGPDGFDGGMGMGMGMGMGGPGPIKTPSYKNMGY